MMILGGLLFPAVVSARRFARRTACLSNLGGLFKASALYMGDHDDAFPTGKDCLDLLAPVGYSPAGLERLRQTPLLSAVLLPYVRSTDAFGCPSDTGASVSESAFPQRVDLASGAFRTCGLSYEYHTALGLAHATGTTVRNQSGVNLLQDLAGHWHGDGGAATPSDTEDDFYGKRSGFRYNMVFTDGHASVVDYAKKEVAWREE